MNDPTVCIDVQNRVLRRVAEEAGGDQIFGNKILVPHAARGSKSVVDEGKVMEEEGGGEEEATEREVEMKERQEGGVGRRGWLVEIKEMILELQWEEASGRKLSVMRPW